LPPIVSVAAGRAASLRRAPYKNEGRPTLKPAALHCLVRGYNFDTWCNFNPVFYWIF